MTEFLTTANRKLRFEPLDDGTLRTAGMRGGDTRLTVPEVVETVRDLLGWLLDQEHVETPGVWDVWGFYLQLCVWLADQKAAQERAKR